MASNIPRHIAVIMDGNGRWAQKKGLPRIYGHRQGAKSVQRIIKSCLDLGIEYLTVYTFSTENWKRPKKEVEAIMKLLGKYLDNRKTELSEYEKIRVRVIGRWQELSLELPSKIQVIMEETRNHEGLNLTLAINYGGRREIMDAVEGVLKDFKAGEGESGIKEDFFRKYFYAPEIPDPDLLIRTAGESRLSNFLLWQTAYSEIYITKKLWPDFKKSDLIKAIKDYQGKRRKFGAV